MESRLETHGEISHRRPPVAWIGGAVVTLSVATELIWAWMVFRVVIWATW